MHTPQSIPQGAINVDSIDSGYIVSIALMALFASLSGEMRPLGS